MQPGDVHQHLRLRLVLDRSGTHMLARGPLCDFEGDCFLGSDMMQWNSCLLQAVTASARGTPQGSAVRDHRCSASPCPVDAPSACQGLHAGAAGLPCAAPRRQSCIQKVSVSFCASFLAQCCGCSGHGFRSQHEPMNKLLSHNPPGREHSTVMQRAHCCCPVPCAAIQAAGNRMPNLHVMTSGVSCKS